MLRWMIARANPRTFRLHLDADVAWDEDKWRDLLPAEAVDIEWDVSSPFDVPGAVATLVTLFGEVRRRDATLRVTSWDRFHPAYIAYRIATEQWQAATDQRLTFVLEPRTQSEDLFCSLGAWTEAAEYTQSFCGNLFDGGDGPTTTEIRLPSDNVTSDALRYLASWVSVWSKRDAPHTIVAAGRHAAIAANNYAAIDGVRHEADTIVRRTPDGLIHTPAYGRGGGVGTHTPLPNDSRVRWFGDHRT